MRIDYRHVSGTASLSISLHYSPYCCTGAYWQVAAANTWEPGYDEPTINTDVASNMVSTASYSDSSGIGPQHGLPTTSTQDPASINLVSKTTYEPPGTAYLRPLTKVSPAQLTTSFAYYGATETRANPCTASSAVVQSGLLRPRQPPRVRKRLCTTFSDVLLRNVRSPTERTGSARPTMRADAPHRWHIPPSVDSPHEQSRRVLPSARIRL